MISLNISIDIDIESPSFFHQPWLQCRIPRHQPALSEPQSRFSFTIFRRIASMDDISTDINGKIAANGPWLCLQRIGGTDQLASWFYNTVTFPYLRYGKKEEADNR